MSERDGADRQDRDPTDWDSGNPVDRIEGTGQNEGNAIQFSWWNLLLLVPLIMLITSLYNTAEPMLFGMPFFYWYQFAFVFVGVACVAIVFVTTRNRRHPSVDAPESGRTDGGDAGGTR
jgi:Protein of unknown function (DUF3311)